jgi:hypothetical protein
MTAVSGRKRGLRSGKSLLHPAPPLALKRKPAGAPHNIYVEDEISL